MGDTALRLKISVVLRCAVDAVEIESGATTDHLLAWQKELQGERDTDGLLVRLFMGGRLSPFDLESLAEEVSDAFVKDFGTPGARVRVQMQEALSLAYEKWRSNVYDDSRLPAVQRKDP